MFVTVHRAFLLSCRPVQDQVHGAGYCTTVEPSISINAQGLPTKLLQMTWFLYGLEETVKSCVLLAHTMTPLNRPRA